MKRGVAYARYSSDMQDDDSLAAQLRAIRTYCLANDIDLVHEYTDAAQSGKTDDRVAFQEMIADSRRHMFEVIVAHKIDRFSRNKYDSAIHKSQLRRLGIRVLFAAQPMSDSPEGRLMEGILEGFAEFYSDNLAQEVMKGQKETALKGEFSGGFAPLGYRIAEKKYVVDEREADAVRFIFQSYADATPYPRVIAGLAERGVTTRFGAVFSKNSLHSILRNPKYVGIHEWNVAIPRIPGHRNGHRRKPESEIIRVAGVIPPIIDQETWNRAQARLTANTELGQRKLGTAAHPYLLSSLLTCTCGTRMIGHTERPRKTKEYHYYRCTGCGFRTSADILDQALMHRLATDILNETGVREYAGALSERADEMADSRENDLRRLRQRYGQLEIEINHMVTAIVSGLSSQAVNERLQATEKEKRRVAADIVMTESSHPVYPSVEELVDRLAAYRQALLSMDASICRSFVKLFVTSATLEPAGEVTFQYSLKPVEQPEDGVYFQMVRTKGLEPLRSPTGT
jgi:site-specific DNA recombinase